LDPDRCRERLIAALAEKNALIEKVHGEEPLSLDKELDCYGAVGDSLRPFVGDTGAEVRDAHAAGKHILFEGAQGLMLDLDHGTYPFVTSSSTGVGGVSSGAGFPPRHIERVLGIGKAYCTRVGEGPFPTELTDETGARIQKAGHEFGATTGRPRRAGWFDAVAVRYAFDLCGADGWVVTKLDILSGFETLRVGVAYEIDGEVFDRYPAHLPSLDGVRVTYEQFPGWQQDIAEVRSWQDLPENARNFVESLEKLVACPVDLVSVGPDREAMLTRPR
jgi:adenylosuccinate synthase